MASRFSYSRFANVVAAASDGIGGLRCFDRVGGSFRGARLRGGTRRGRGALDSVGTPLREDRREGFLRLGRAHPGGELLQLGLGRGLRLFERGPLEEALAGPQRADGLLGEPGRGVSRGG